MGGIDSNISNFNIINGLQSFFMITERGAGATFLCTCKIEKRARRHCTSSKPRYRTYIYIYIYRRYSLPAMLACAKALQEGHRPSQRVASHLQPRELSTSIFKRSSMNPEK